MSDMQPLPAETGEAGERSPDDFPPHLDGRRSGGRRAAPEQARPTNGFVQSLERGLAVIRAFDADHAELTVSDVARITGITRAAARRFLLTLVEIGYVRTDGRQFALLPKVLELGYAYLSAVGMPEVALPHLRTLATAVRESSYLSVLSGYETVCVAHVPMRRIWSVSLTVGTRLPALATAAGRAMLAGQPDEWLDSYLTAAHLTAITTHTITDLQALRVELAAVRQQGWALVDQELEEGLRTIAAPIHDKRGRIVAAVSFSTLAGTGDLDSFRMEFLGPLLSCAAAIDADLRSAHSTHQQ